MKALLTLALALPLFAQSVASTPRGVLVAHDHVIELYGKWKTDGVSAPGAIAVSAARAAVLDPIHDRVAIVDLENGRTTFAHTKSTPVAAAFAGNDLLVLDRDAHAIEKIGRGEAIELGADPEFLSVAGNRAYVYSRIDGALQEIGIEPFALLRTIRIAPFASAMQCDAKSAYLAYRLENRVHVVDLDKMQDAGDFRVGSPMDIAVVGAQLAIAGPVGGRVRLIAGRESTSHAFVRGLLGIGGFREKETIFPGGVDRVVALGGRWLAFDSSTGTLYSATKNGTIVLARGLAPHSFALTPEGVAYWQNGTLVAQKLPDE